MAYSFVLGQAASVSLGCTAISSELLNANFDVHTPTGQIFVSSMCMALVYGSILACTPSSGSNGGAFFAALRARGWLYALLALIDLEGNFISVTAFQFTNLTSVLVLNSFTTPCVCILSFIFLKKRYLLRQKLAVLTCQIGLMIVIYADYLVKPGATEGGKNRLLGDALCLLSVLLLATSNVAEEHTVKSYSKLEFLGMLSAFEAVFAGVQTVVLERDVIASINWSDYRIALLYAMFAASMFSFYSLVSMLMARTNAIVFSLSILSTNLYTLFFGICVFHYKFHFTYFIGYALVIFGSVLYLFWDRPAELADANSDQKSLEDCGETGDVTTAERFSPTCIEPGDNVRL